MVKEYTNLKGIREIDKHLPPPRSSFYQFLQLLLIPLPGFKLVELVSQEIVYFTYDSVNYDLIDHGRYQLV